MKMATANQFRQTNSEIVIGSGAQVSDQLHRTAMPLALAVTFEDQGQSPAYEEVLLQVATFLPRLIRQREFGRLELIVEALLPDL
jgi:hypothetical protein